MGKALEPARCKVCKHEHPLGAPHIGLGPAVTGKRREPLPRPRRSKSAVRRAIDPASGPLGGLPADGARLP